MRILHTNDFHGKLTAARADFLRALKSQEPDTLYVDCGDLIKTGNLGVPLRPDPGWALLAEAGCDASVPGNRESHVLASAFKAKLEGSQHPVLCCNLRDRQGELVLAPSLTLTRSGLTIGIVAAMVPMVTAKMATQAASAYLWDPPIASLAEHARGLRPQVDLLIALTHIGHRQDRALAEAVPEIDLIIGGHSHTVLEACEKVGSTWIAQAGSHGRYVGEIQWDSARREANGRLIPLP